MAVFAVALALRWAYALLLPVRITADAAYYMAVAENLYRGRGLVVDYSWQYLSGIPTGFPIPSNGYWMPATSWVIAASYLVAGGPSERAAEVPSLLTGALLCALTAWLAGLLFARWQAALLAGLFAAVSFHLIGVALFPDHFGLAASLATLSLLAIWAAWWQEPGATPTRRKYLLTALSGALAGLTALTRNDAALLLVVPAAAAVGLRRRRETKAAVAVLASALLPFALVVAPWLLRQQLVFGTPWGDRALRTAFLTTYNDLFRVDLSHLTPREALRGGVGHALSVRGYVLYREVRLLAQVVGVAMLLGLGVLWQAEVRRRATPWLAFLIAGLLATAFVMPYPSRSGGFWHLMPALCPVLFALGAGACLRLLEWSRGRAGQFAPAAGRLAVFLCVASLLPYWALAPREIKYEQSLVYPRVARRAVEALRPPPQVVLTDDSWSFYHVTHQPCAQYPSDGPEAALKVADRLGAQYLLTLEESPSGAALDPQTILANHRFKALWRYPSDEGNVLVYRILPDRESGIEDRESQPQRP